MPDDKSKRAPEDARRINLAERYEIIYWTCKLGVSETQLESAVMAVGTSAAAVEDYLLKGNK